MVKKAKILKTEWLYQVRITVNQETSDALRRNERIGVSGDLYQIAETHGTVPICTYDGFYNYCKEAEESGIEKYSLYDWTKKTIEDPVKKEKHLKSFAFYWGDEQVYEKNIAQSLHDDLLNLLEANKIEDLKLLDSNPKNNPQPPEKKR